MGADFNFTGLIDMQQAIIDCQTGKVTYVDLSPAEEAKRLEEIEKNKVEVEKAQHEYEKQQLINESSELREMEDNPEVFSAEEIAKKQDEVNKMKEKLEKPKD